MHPLLETMLKKFDLSEEVILTIDQGGHNRYIRGRIVDIQEKFFLVSTNISILRVSPDSIIRIAKTSQTKTKDKPKTVESKPGTNKSKTEKETKAPVEKESTPKPQTVKPKDNSNSSVSEKKTATLTKAEDSKGAHIQVAKKQDETTTNQVQYDPVLAAKKAPLPKLGDIVIIEEKSITIKPIQGKQFTVPRDRIIDKTLIKEVNTQFVSNNFSAIPVTWATYNGKVVCVLGSMTIEKINSRVNSSTETDNLEQAIALAELLDYYSPNDYNKTRIRNLKARISGGKIERINDEAGNTDSVQPPYYVEALKARLSGNLDKSIELYYKAITSGETVKRELISQIVEQYIIQGEYEKAYQILEQFHFFDFPDSFFPKTANNVNWLSARLRPIGHLDRYIEILLMRLDFATKKGALINIYIELAWAYSHLDDKDIIKSEEFYKKVLELDPSNAFAIEGLRDISSDPIEIDEDIKDLPQSFLASDIVNDSTVEIPKNTSGTDDLKAKYKQFGVNSYKERADVCKAIAVVSHLLGNDEEKSIYLAKYFQTSAMYAHKDNKYDDACVRFLLCESVAQRQRNIRKNRDEIQDAIASYLCLYNAQNPNSFFSAPRMKKIFESTSYFEDPRFYSDLSTLLLYKIPFSIIINQLWTTRYQTSALDYLARNGLKPSELTESSFKSAFKKLATEKKKKISDMIQFFSNMKNEDTFQGMIARLESFDCFALVEEIDKERYEYVKGPIIDALRSYLNQPYPSKKSYIFRDVKKLLKETICIYTEEPTRFSYDCLVYMLKRLLNMVNSDFESVMSGTMPSVSISEIGDCSINEGIVSFQLQVSNEKGRSYITKYHVSIEKSDIVSEHLKGDEISFGQLDGGESITIPQQIRLKAGEEGAISISVKFYYDTFIGPAEPITRELALHLYSDDIPEDNPYSVFSGGDPINIDEMFYGREELISDLSKSLLTDGVSKRVLIYGQRRSGKTSILNKLQRELERQGAFCVQISLQSLPSSGSSSAAFYAYILDQIAKTLYKAGWTAQDSKYSSSEHDIVFDDYEKCPEIAIVSRFIDDLAEISDAFKAKMDWKSRKLILMIDEFTTLYSRINEGYLPKSIMENWKSIFDNPRVNCSLVLIGQDNIPKFKSEPWASNSFAAIEDRRISYLTEDEAKQMIIKPIKDKNKESRYVGSAVQRILEYTAGSPYYLMIFLDELVVYMRKKRIGKVTEVDIDEVAAKCMNTRLTDTQFANLYAAVDPTKDEVSRNKRVLSIIASGMDSSSNKDGVDLDYIYSKTTGICEKDVVDDLLADFVTREVLIKKNNNYRIKVILFQKWLLQH